MIHIIWILSVLYHVLKYFLFKKHYFHYTIYAIILIVLHRTAGPFTLYFSFHSQYNFHWQYIYNRDYLRPLFDYITYFSNNSGQNSCLSYCHTHMQVCYIDIRNTTVWSIASIYIYTLIIFLSVKYAVQIVHRLFGSTVLHQVYRLVRYCSDITQYIYYCEYFCLGPALRFCDRHTDV